ncbi:hypothetical protein AJ78_00164 [Emergomyces pasteurianus Ep9510]|uniref:Uncharacterized protein n=1 Tax=Emergomyces pasteurianus Ep9510 TaxID=1447872 RepID=A0A1J9PVQ0_9EURO|nr:hypothetical protein AJ78_00164 [Emergomyces pasteurianus Ep9510]
MTMDATHSWALEGIYASLQSSPHPVPNSHDLSSCQPVINQNLGLTHLPGPQKQHDSSVSLGKASILSVDGRLTVSPSPSSSLRLRQQSPDSLFGDEGTSFELSWENQLMNILSPDALSATHSNEQNTDKADNIPEIEPVEGAKRIDIQTTSGPGVDINCPPVNLGGDQQERDCRKRPFDDDSIWFTRSSLENDAQPTKKQHVKQTSPFDEELRCSTVTSGSHGCEHDQSVNGVCLPPDFQLPNLPEIPDFSTSFQIPDAFDFDNLNTLLSTDNSGIQGTGGFSSSSMPYTSIPPNNLTAELDENPSVNAAVCDSQNAQLVGKALVTSDNAPRSSICSSSTPLSSDSHDIHDSDKICFSSNRLNRSHSERQLSPDSLFDGSSPIAAPLIENVSEANTVRHREEACPSQDVSAALQFAENDITKNFCLSKQDILATQYREIFRHIPRPRGYISPYPKHHGPLGYFPSAPATHARCIEVAPDDAAERLEEYRRKLQEVRSELKKHKNVWLEWKAVDPTTGKNKEQTLKAEHFRLKRSLFAQEKKAEKFRKQAEDWRGQFNHLALAYNGLVQHVHMLQAAHIPQHPLPVSQLPPGHPTPVPSPQPELVTARSCMILPPDPSKTSRTKHQPPPITIDLTDEESMNHNTTSPSSAPPNEEEHSRNYFAEDLRKAMCRKEYHWLGNKNPPLRPLLPAAPFLGRDLQRESQYTRQSETHPCQPLATPP